MRTVLHDDRIATTVALRVLGLSEGVLREAAMQGYLARTNCTANHPPMYPSFVAWGEAVRALREQLLPLGWTRRDENNYPRTVHPGGRIAIAIAAGNEATGMPNESPTTSSAKGPSTVAAVELNRLQYCLPFLEPELRTADDDESHLTTWLLLIHHAAEEIRSELSLPFEIGADGRINGWRERIILLSLPLDPEPLVVTPPPQPNFDIAIRRKV